MTNKSGKSEKKWKRLVLRSNQVHPKISVAGWTNRNMDNIVLEGASVEAMAELHLDNVIIVSDVSVSGWGCLQGNAFLAPGVQVHISGSGDNDLDASYLSWKDVAKKMGLS